MNINEAFPSGKFLKSDDLQGRIVKLKIASLTYEKIGTDTKLVMYFVGKDKGMVLNKTNARTIAEVYGDDTDNWVGGDINVFSMKVDFQGRMVDGLRVKIPPRAAPARQAPPQHGHPAGAALAQSAPPPPAMTGGYADIMDDEIPFAPEWR